jgi:hypothetical protein
MTKNTNTLRVLKLSKNEMGFGFNFKEFFPNLNTGLLELYLEKCNLGDVGATYLAEYMQNNLFLRKLMIKQNGIEDKGAAHFREVLTHKSKLEMIDLSEN